MKTQMLTTIAIITAALSVAPLAQHSAQQ